MINEIIVKPDGEDSMNYDYIALILFFALLIAASIPLGKYMARVFSGERTFITPIIRPVERIIYRICRIDESEEMSWKTYAWGFIMFNVFSIVILMLMQMIQGLLPLHPQKFPGVSWHLAFNTAVSFVTNTNWQAYGGESTMSYLTQMAGLTVQNFVSAGIGMAAGLALIRGFIPKEADFVC